MSGGPRISFPFVRPSGKVVTLLLNLYFFFFPRQPSRRRVLAIPNEFVLRFGQPDGRATGGADDTPPDAALVAVPHRPAGRPRERSEMIIIIIILSRSDQKTAGQTCKKKKNAFSSIIPIAEKKKNRCDDIVIQLIPLILVIFFPNTISIDYSVKLKLREKIIIFRFSRILAGGFVDNFFACNFSGESRGWRDWKC